MWVSPFTKEDKEKKGLQVKYDKETQHLWYGAVNPYTYHFTNYHFSFKPTGEMTDAMLEHIIDKVFRTRKLTSLFGTTKKSNDRIMPRQIRGEVIKAYKNMAREVKRVGPVEYKNSHTGGGGTGGTEESHEAVEGNTSYINPVLLDREAEDSGKTTFFAGRSFSGKTYTTAMELNKISGLKRGGSDKLVKDRGMYERIFILTSSPNAKPWALLKNKEKIKIIPFYLPRLVSLLKRISDISENKVPWLLVLDDVFGDMGGNGFKKLILTLRNSNISTVVLSQYLKHLDPQCRNSVHQIVVTKFNPAEWEYFIGSQLEQHVEDELGLADDHKLGKKKLAKKWTQYVDSDLVLYNQREDKLNLIKRDKF